MHNQRFPFGGRRRQRAEIVAGRPQTTVHDENIGLRAAFAQNRHQIIQVIAYGIAAGQRNTLLETKISQPGRIRIDDLSR